MTAHQIISFLPTLSDAELDSVTEAAQAELERRIEQMQREIAEMRRRLDEWSSQDCPF